MADQAAGVAGRLAHLIHGGLQIALGGEELDRGADDAPLGLRLSFFLRTAGL